MPARAFERCWLLVACGALSACACPVVENRFPGAAQARIPSQAAMTVREKDRAAPGALHPTGPRKVSGAEIAASVHDAGGEAVSGVLVTASNVETGKSRWFITGDDGSGYLRGLERGNWVLVLKKEGFATARHQIDVVDSDSGSARLALTTGARL